MFKVQREVPAIKAETIEVGNDTKITLVFPPEVSQLISGRSIAKAGPSPIGTVHGELARAGLSHIQIGKLRYYRRADVDALFVKKEPKTAKTEVPKNATNDEIARANGFSVGGAR